MGRCSAPSDPGAPSAEAARTRSLVAPALTLMLLLGWTVLPHPWLWTLAVIAIVALPPAAAVLVDLLRKSDETLLTWLSSL